MLDFTALDKHITALIEAGCFPSATLCVFHHNELVKETAYGCPDPISGLPARVNTAYDVASLSKLFAGTAFLSLCEQGVFDLDEPVCRSFPAFGGEKEIRASANALLQDQPDELLGRCDGSAVTWRHVLVHNSGLGWAPLHLRCKTPQEAIEYICTMPFAYETGKTVLYTDLGLILMGVAMERRCGKTLDVLVDELVCRPLGLENTGYRRVSRGAVTENTAPTEICQYRGMRMHGLVHDENSYFFDGVAGHAGIFSTARDVARLTQSYFAAIQGQTGGPISPALARDMIRFRQMNRWDRRGILFQLRILDTDAHSFPLSRPSFGHTGFTGTCTWCDPERALCFALLTNDVYNGRENRTLGAKRKGIVEELISAIDHADTCTREPGVK